MSTRDSVSTVLAYVNDYTLNASGYSMAGSSDSENRTLATIFSPPNNISAGEETESTLEHISNQYEVSAQIMGTRFWPKRAQIGPKWD